MVLEFISLVIGAYLLGSIPTAYLIGKWTRGIDIRQYGSGNVGASNVMATISKRWSIIVTFFDIGKGALMVYAARILGLGIAQQATIGIAAIIGHNWPMFLNFQGGRGIFTSLGVIAMLSPWVGLIAPVVSYAFAPFGQLSLGVAIALVSLPIFSWFLSQPLHINEPIPVTLGYLAILVIAMFRRVTAPRTSVTDSITRRELIINRLLFDRDIKDRKAWLDRAPM
ncbi:MAG: glycerol-3-phosphate acyltransferase [Dehalococcoidales bacterium]|nr:glycerol-3-phosphate acyltransferase [Dehalococcoidales bacterium]